MTPCVLGRVLTPVADAECAERNAATLAWMQHAFELTQRENSRAIMLIIQGNPAFESPPADPERTGYDDFLAAPEKHTVAFGKPVVLVHGDSHYFRTRQTDANGCKENPRRQFHTWKRLDCPT